MRNPATRFLNTEKVRVERELYWIEADMHQAPLAEREALADEYRRRYEIVSAVLPLAVTSQAALEAVEQKLTDATMLLDELLSAGRSDVDDQLAAVLHIDVLYLGGLLTRLQAAVQAETFTYLLANIDQL